MNITILLWSHNGAADIGETLERLLPLPERVRLLIVDQGSHDQTVAIARDWAARHAGVTVIERGHPLALGGRIKAMLRLVKGDPPDAEALVAADVVVLFDQSARALPGWHEAICRPFIDDGQIAVVGCAVYGETGQLDPPNSYAEPPYRFAEHVPPPPMHPTANPLIDAEYITGPVLAFRMTALETAGLLDQRAQIASYEAIDVCYRLNHAKFRVVLSLAARVTHNPDSAPSAGLQRIRMEHRQQLALILKTWPFEDLLHDAAKAELRFINEHAGHSHFVAHQQAYEDALMDFNSCLAARRQPEHALTSWQREALHEVFVGFQQASVIQHSQMTDAYRRIDQLGALITTSEQVWNIREISATNPQHHLALQGFQRALGFLSTQQSHVNAVLVHLLYWLMELSQRSITTQQQFQRAHTDLDWQLLRFENLTLAIQAGMNQALKPLEQRRDALVGLHTHVRDLITGLNHGLRTNAEHATRLLNYLASENMHEHHNTPSEL